MNGTENDRMLMALALALGMALAAPALADQVATSKQATAQQGKPARPAQTVYPSPEDAVKALYEIIKSHDVKSIYRVLGPGSETLIYTGDEVADQQMRERFLEAFDTSFKIERQNDTRSILLVGPNDAPFPFPLIRNKQGWVFDAKAGAEEIVNRRIGENELFAIKVCLAYGDAQREYAEKDRDGDGLLEYAPKFRSSEGKRDGLYWETAEGEPPSPLGPLVARAKGEGYTAKQSEPVPYHGYFYRILTAQGKDASGGAYDYVVNGNMIGGYALVAYPARWGASGVMSFICNHDGVVYQKNLGAGTVEAARAMESFDPESSWSKVPE